MSRRSASPTWLTGPPPSPPSMFGGLFKISAQTVKDVIAAAHKALAPDQIGTVRARGLGVAMKCQGDWVHCGDGHGTYRIEFDRIADWPIVYRPDGDS
jgi:hypothetical protein